jgi:hypothetical protein
MRKIPKWVFVAAPVGFALFIAIGGGVVMLLWNWLAPALFGLQQVTFWQALGLLTLCRILFGGFGGSGGGGRYQRRRTIERWERMTPEEREKFREGLHGRWGRAATPDSNA